MGGLGSIPAWKASVLVEESIHRQLAFPAPTASVQSQPREACEDADSWWCWCLGDTKRPVKWYLSSWQPTSLGAGRSVGSSVRKCNIATSVLELEEHREPQLSSAW